MNDALIANKWRPGQSGNPGGRKRVDPVLRDACREMTPEILKKLRALAQSADSDATSLGACKLILAYGHGTPESLKFDDSEKTDDRVPTEQEAAEAAAELRRLRESLGH